EQSGESGDTVRNSVGRVEVLGIGARYAAIGGIANPPRIGQMRLASPVGTGWHESLLSSRFFFQAEDGIRDLYVTGVQTCALPISFRVSGKNIDIGEVLRARINDRVAEATSKYFDGGFSGHVTIGKEGFGFRTECVIHRSEERRVGKECRFRRDADHCKTKNSCWSK